MRRSSSRDATPDRSILQPAAHNHRLRNASLAALVALQIGAVLAMPAKAAEITVCPSGCDHSTIGAALSSATAGDVIQLRGGITYTENLVISKGITIQGPGPDELATIAGLGTWSTVAVETPALVALRNVRITGGTGTVISEDRYGGGVYINHENARVTIQSSWIVSNTVIGDGGGIYLDAGRLDLLDTVLSENVASLNGGGIFNDEGGVLNVERSEFYNNEAVLWTDPGAVLSNAGALFSRDEATILDSHFHDNRATTSGGAIVNRGRGVMTIRDTIIERNHTLDGGGIFNSNKLDFEGGSLNGNTATEFGGGLSSIGIATLTNITIDGNESAAGAGVYTRVGTAPRQDGEVVISGCSMIGNKAMSGAGRGGAIFAEREGDVTVELCTISDNEASRGAAMSEIDGQIEVSHSTVVNNRSSGSDVAVIDATGAGTIRFGNTFIHNPGSVNCSVRASSLGHNLDGDETCGLTRTGDISPRVVTILPLADNGGSSRTHALAAGSPAIDAGHPGLCLDRDQRGFAAPVDGDGDGTALCDIGSYEFGATADGATPSPGTGTAEPTPTPTPITTPGVLDKRIYLPKAVKNAG